jgi:hypothetical protein
VSANRPVTQRMWRIHDAGPAMSGRQDLNLRPLDPQPRRSNALTIQTANSLRLSVPVAKRSVPYRFISVDSGELRYSPGSR